MEFAAAAEPIRTDVVCPFCVGNEHETPPHIGCWDSEGRFLNEGDAESNGSTTDWLARVVPNKFPSFPSGKLVSPYETTDFPVSTDHGPYAQVQLPGVQELVIPSPRHVSSFGELTETEVRVGLMAAQQRVEAISKKRGIKHVMLFMNCRSRAGASLSHIHLQLIGIPLISQRLEDRVARNRQHFEAHGKTLIQSLVEWERRQQQRMLLETEYFNVFCPFASRFPYQIWIAPKSSEHSFVQLPDAARCDLGLICRKLIKRLDKRLGQPAYNLLLHMAPREINQHDHWYVEILPRLTHAAGLEWGTDVWVNPVSPEEAASEIGR